MNTVPYTTLYTNFKVNGWASLISEEYIVAEHFTVQCTVTSTVDYTVQNIVHWTVYCTVKFTVDSTKTSKLLT